ncbi:MAG TPA: PAS domain S-box protein [Noviherbaspirillum sp.]|nr:PAS domain S-box protein [Noviherbaspirillum sp.]
MPGRTLAELMTWNIVTIAPDATLTEAAEVMETARISSVLVAAGEPVGIVTERDILRALQAQAAAEHPVAAVMGQPLVKAPQTLSMHEAYRLMNEAGVRHLLVTDAQGRPTGIVSESDFRFHLGLDVYRRLQDVRTVMNTRMPLLPPDARLRQAVAAMAAQEANCVVVAAAGTPLGIITERDAVRFYRQGSASLERALAEVMSSPVATIDVGTGLHEAMERMHALRIRHLVVLGGDGKVAGMLSEHDVVRQLETEYLDFALSQTRQVRQRLQDSEMRRHAVFDLANEFMGVLDPDGILRDINRAALALVGKQADDVLGLPFWDGPWWSHDAALQGRLRQAFAQLESGGARFEATHPADDGSLRHVDFRLKPVQDEAGRLVLALAEGNDITDLKRAETELRQFQRAVEQCPVSIIITDTQPRIQYVNPKFSDITGYAREEVVGRNPRLLQSGLTPAATYAELWQTLGGGGMWTGELCNRRKNGEIFWELARILPITDPAGTVTHFLAVKEDITERRRVEEQRRLAASVFKSSHDGILITDADGIIVEVNRAFSELTGYLRTEVVGRSARLLNSGHHDADFFQRMFQTAAEQEFWRGEIWTRTKDGAINVVLMTVSAVRDLAGKLTQYVGVFTDITQKKESEQRLERLAHYDALTGMPNRSLFRDRLQQAVRKSHRHGQILALFFLDLDHFKEVNDTLGHVAGDALLVEAARRIASCVRESDTVARLGGDEFTVLVPELESRETAERLARDMIGALAAPFTLGTETASVSASIGIALYPGDADDAESLTIAADQAMYDAKARGRNGFCFFGGSVL